MTDDRPPADDPLGTLLFEMTVVDDSTSPLQLVSAELLEHYRHCEAELIALKSKMGAEIRSAKDDISRPQPGGIAG